MDFFINSVYAAIPINQYFLHPFWSSIGFIVKALVHIEIFQYNIFAHKIVRLYREVIKAEMLKSIVFDLGGTLMEYAGMPLNWSDYYICGFEKVNEILKLNLSENDLQKSANKLKSYNPRTSKREYEIKPEEIFNNIISNWEEKPAANKVIEIFFEGLGLKANIYEYSTELLKKCRNWGFKTACLTDLPNGMPDSLFKPGIEKILPYFDLYVSSQICGVRKPNKGGICYIADAFEIRETEILFVGDEEKDFLTALNAGCGFVYIDDFLEEISFPR